MANIHKNAVRFSFAAKCASALTWTVLGLGFATPCWARLGGDVASVLADQQAWEASSTQTALAGATLYVQALPNGVMVRQYVDANGFVFAVAWDGPVLPDFTRLLGEHAATYADAMRQQKRGVNLHSTALVIEAGGMMRAFSGRAYLPAKLPTAWAVQDIR